MKSSAFAGLVAWGGLALAIACSDRPSGPIGPSPPDRPPSGPATLLAVGDIGQCGSPGVDQTARLVEGLPGHLVLAGDLAYFSGTMRDFLECFDPAWGSQRTRWRPVPGNHEYETRNAAGYFQYFGAAAGIGYYSFRAGDWFVLMLDSNVPMRPGSPQYQFVELELQANPRHCTMAVSHHPLYSSGPNGPTNGVRDMWRLLHERGVDVWVAAHDHLYERFGKQDADGRSDGGGIRQFVAGTGGARLYDFQRTAPNSQARVKAFGVLQFTLNPGNYAWTFLDVAGVVADAGTDTCH